jgi:hypothetical protein
MSSIITESQDVQKIVSVDSQKNMEENSKVEGKSLGFSHKTIEKLGDKVKLSDTDEKGLELYCYTNCSADDDEDLHKCRGIVLHGEEIVMKAFPYTVEYVHTNEEKIEENIVPNFKECTFYDSYEGFLVRMFYFENQWYISTHRKLNAFRSKWASKESFGTCFKRSLEAEVLRNENLSKAIPENDLGLLERFQSILDKNKQYMFLVLHTAENRIVCLSPEEPRMFHVGTFVNGELVMTENCHIPYPVKHTFSNTNELVDYVSRIDIRYLQGVICFAPHNKQYKIVHSQYMELFEVRGNEPSIKFRYIQVRMNGKQIRMLFDLYPEMADTFDEIENTIYDIAKKIYSSYVQRFIKKQFVTVPAEDFSIIRECHKWHEEDRITNRVSLNKVIDVINKQNPTTINRMIRAYKLGNYEDKLAGNKQSDFTVIKKKGKKFNNKEEVDTKKE